MTQEISSSTLSGGEPVLPFGRLVDWYNSQVNQVDDRGAELSDPARTPTPQTLAGAAALLGELRGVEAARNLLRDFGGLLIALHADATGELNQLPDYFVDSENNIDKT